MLIFRVAIAVRIGGSHDISPQNDTIMGHFNNGIYRISLLLYCLNIYIYIYIYVNAIKSILY